MRRRTSGERRSRHVNSGCWWSLNIRLQVGIFTEPESEKDYCLSRSNVRCNFFKTWSPFLESPDSLSGPEKVIYACSVCIETQSFNNFENDTIKNIVDEAKLTGL